MSPLDTVPCPYPPALYQRLFNRETTVSWTLLIRPLSALGLPPSSWLNSSLFNSSPFVTRIPLLQRHLSQTFIIYKQSIMIELTNSVKLRTAITLATYWLNAIFRQTCFAPWTIILTWTGLTPVSRKTIMGSTLLRLQQWDSSTLTKALTPHRHQVLTGKDGTIHSALQIGRKAHSNIDNTYRHNSRVYLPGR